MTYAELMGDDFVSQTEFDRYLNCVDCGCDFVFSASEQKHFLANDVKAAPSRCHNCRVILRSRGASRRGSGGPITAVVCASCYGLTYVPFKPNGQKPVYCGSCLFNPSLELCV